MYGDRDEFFGGTDSETCILKYNGYRFEKPASLVAQINNDLQTLLDNLTKKHHTGVRDV